MNQTDITLSSFYYIDVKIRHKFLKAKLTLANINVYLIR